MTFVLIDREANDRMRVGDSYAAGAAAQWRQHASSHQLEAEEAELSTVPTPVPLALPMVPVPPMNVLCGQHTPVVLRWRKL